MTNHQATHMKRALFLTVAVIAIAAALFIRHELYHGADYSPDNVPADQLSHNGGADEPLSAVEEPMELSKVVRLTFGGNCTVGAALGTDTYGTLNHTAVIEGTDFFFSELNTLFRRDDCTVLGCAAVLTDRELAFDESSGNLPYLAPSENAAIFSSAFVELVSLANERAAVCGTEGLNDTQTAVEQAGLHRTDDSNAYYMEQAGLRIAILGASAWESDAGETIAKRASVVSETCDYVAVYANRTSGAEDHYAAIARQAIDAGADLVCFTGAPSDEDEVFAETYNEGIIVNSLGTLIDGGAFSASDTALFRITLTVEENTITEVVGELIPVTYGTHPWQPFVK